MTHFPFFSRFFGGISMACALGLLAACSLPPVDMPAVGPDLSVIADYAGENSLLSVLGYYQRLQRMTPAELLRERSVLLADIHTSKGQIRLAMLMGQPRTTTDLARAQALLDNVLRSATPDAVNLHSLAHVLVMNFQERQRLETQNDKIIQQMKAAEMQNDKLGQQLKANRQQIDELQEKLDALADIERSLQARPAVGNQRPGKPR